MKYKLLLLFFAVPFLCAAQPAGYMGKRFTVGYGVESMVGFHQTHMSDYGGTVEGDYNVTLNLTHLLSIRYVVGRRQELCASAGYYKTEFDVIHNQIGTPGELRDENYLSAIDYSFGFKLYHRRLSNVAPLGWYSKWEVYYGMNTVSYPFRHDYYYGNVPGGKVSYKSLGAGFSLGRQRILFDKLVLEYGFRTSLCFKLGASNATKDEERYLVGFATTEMLHHEFLNVYLGLGFLAF